MALVGIRIVAKDDDGSCGSCVNGRCVATGVVSDSVPSALRGIAGSFFASCIDGNEAGCMGGNEVGIDTVVGDGCVASFGRDRAVRGGGARCCVLCMYMATPRRMPIAISTRAMVPLCGMVIGMKGWATEGGRTCVCVCVAGAA